MKMFAGMCKGYALAKKISVNRRLVKGMSEVEFL